MSKLTLIIDTSIHGAAIGIATLEGQHQKLIFDDASGDVMDSARQLPLMVERGLSQVGAQVSDLSRFIVSRGPGSFTGIRVGLAYVYGLSCGIASGRRRDVQIAGVSSLSECARSLAQLYNQDLALFLPSTKITGYASLLSGNRERVIPVDTTASDLQDLWPSSWFVIGEWAALDSLSNQRNAKILQSFEPKIAAKMAINAIGATICEVDNLKWSQEMPEAIYLRKSTVEEKAEHLSKV